MRALAEAGISTTLLAAIQTALPFLTRTRKITVSQLIEEFSELKKPQWRPLTARNFRDAAKKFCTTFAERDPATLTSQEITVWLNATYPSPASIAHTIRTLNPAFSYALRQKHITETPFTLVERHRNTNEKAIDLLTPAEATGLLASAPRSLPASSGETSETASSTSPQTSQKPAKYAT